VHRNTKRKTDNDKEDVPFCGKTNSHGQEEKNIAQPNEVFDSERCSLPKPYETDSESELERQEQQAPSTLPNLFLPAMTQELLR